MNNNNNNVYFSMLCNFNSHMYKVGTDLAEC